MRIEFGRIDSGSKCIGWCDHWHCWNISIPLMLCVKSQWKTFRILCVEPGTTPCVETGVAPNITPIVENGITPCVEPSNTPWDDRGVLMTSWPSWAGTLSAGCVALLWGITFASDLNRQINPHQLPSSPLDYSPPSPTRRGITRWCRNVPFGWHTASTNEKRQNMWNNIDIYKPWTYEKSQ